MNKNYLTTIFIVLFTFQIGMVQKPLQCNEEAFPVFLLSTTIQSVSDRGSRIGYNFNNSSSSSGTTWVCLNTVQNPIQKVFHLPA